MKRLLVSITFFVLLVIFVYSLKTPHIISASFAAPPAEISDIPLDKQAVLSTAIQNATEEASLDEEWPFTNEIIPVPSASESATPTATSAAIPGEFCLHVPVILYHHIQPLSEADLLGHAQLTVDNEIFEKQMAYLVSSGYTALSADQLVQALLTHQSLPEKSIVITIDDGYIDNYTYAFLMAKKYHLIMNFMIPTGLIGKPDYMTWDHLKEMADSPYAKLYNHTESHAAMGLISQTEIEKELDNSTNAFKAQLGLDVNIFTYPYGSFSPLAIDMLKKHGFIAAFTTDPGRLQCSEEIMTLRRDHIGNAPLSSYGL